MKLTVIIAVYNEAPTIAVLLDRVWAQPLPGVAKEIIIVESNSTDGSREIVADFVASRPLDPSATVQVIYQAEPKGKGHAIRQGFAAATGDILLIQDADLEYDVADYPDLLRPIIEGQAAFVLGSRHMGSERWEIRKFQHRGLQSIYMNVGGALFHMLFNAVFRTHLSDPTTMYKVFRANCLNGLNFSCDRFDFDYELLGKLICAGFSPLEVPVSYKSRGFDEGKKIRMFRDPLTWIVAIIAIRFTALSDAKRRSRSASAQGRPHTDAGARTIAISTTRK